MKLTKIMIVAVGGQGNILAARVLGEAALTAGVPVRMSEFHGMAQRGGVVESMVLLGPGNSSCISDGDADLLLGFEPCETIRAMAKCNGSSVVITNTRPVPPFTVGMGIDQYPDVEEALGKIRNRVAKLVPFNATELSVQAGSKLSLNMVMLGALAHSLTDPMTPDLFRRMIQEKTKPAFVKTNLKAFDLGYEAAGSL